MQTDLYPGTHPRLRWRCPGFKDVCSYAPAAPHRQVYGWDVRWFKDAYSEGLRWFKDMYSDTFLLPLLTDRLSAATDISLSHEAEKSEVCKPSLPKARTLNLLPLTWLPQTLRVLNLVREGLGYKLRIWKPRLRLFWTLQDLNVWNWNQKARSSTHNSSYLLQEPR